MAYILTFSAETSKIFALFIYIIIGIELRCICRHSKLSAITYYTTSKSEMANKSKLKSITLGTEDYGKF